jgi:hypothetical protein
MKQRYEDEPQTITMNEFKSIFKMTPQREEIILQNNFGLCN